MLSLHTNIAALSSQNAVRSNQSALATSMTRLGTGLRVNSAMDDAAGLQIATRLNAQTRGMAVAQRNTQNGISMLQTGEGALNEVSNILLRMKDLATEAFTASSTTDDKTAMQAEYDSLGRELANIVANTSFGGEKLFGSSIASATAGGTAFASASGITFQIGASTGETMTVSLQGSLNSVKTSLTSISANYSTAAATTGSELSATANSMIGTLDTAIANVGTLRSELGAAANRLNHVHSNLANMSTNTEAAKGRILDVDYAKESAAMTSRQLLQQASTAMLKQSSSMSQLALSLLQ